MSVCSELPLDILFSISKRIDDSNIHRFRSVSTSWRSSCRPGRPLFSNYQLPAAAVANGTTIKAKGLFLIKSINRSWLIKSDPGCGWGMTLYCPLSAYRILGGSFRRKILDVSKFQVLELGYEYNFDPPVPPMTKRLVVIPMGTDDDHFVCFAAHFTGQLAFLRPGDEDWTVLENTFQALDLASFEGRFYAVHQDGRTCVVDQSGMMTWFNNSLPSNYNHHFFYPRSFSEFLVESEGELLLVGVSFYNAASRGPFQFQMYKLNTERSEWDEVELQLGNQVLLLGEAGSFSVSASQLGWPRGNFIIFHITGLSLSTPNYRYEEMDSYKQHIYVYDLDNGKTTSLDKCCNQLDLFSPPVEWFPESDQTLQVHEYLPLISSFIRSCATVLSWCFRSVLFLVCRVENRKCD